MKKYILYFCVGLFFLMTGVSCSKKMIVAERKQDTLVNHGAEFNYLYSEGLKQKLLGNNSDALKSFEQCIILDPESDAAYYEMAEITMSMGDVISSKKFARRAVDIDEGNLWYLSLLADLYYQDRDLDSSAIYLEKTLLYYPENDDTRLQLANVYSENAEYDKAAEIFEYLDQKFGINENSTLLKVKNLILLKDYNEAERSVLLLMDKFPEEILYRGLLAEIYGEMGKIDEASNIYGDLLEKDPDDAQLQLSLLEFLLNQESYIDMLSFLNTMLINRNVEKDDKVSFFIALIEDTAITGSYIKNLELSLMLLESEYKDDNVVLLLRPQLYQKLGRLAEAISRMDDYIKKFPDNYYAWEQLLLLYSETGDFEKLYTKGKECATKFNRSILAKLLYATGAAEMKDYKAALEELRKATILANEDKSIIMQILSMEADYYYRQGDFQNSFIKYEELLVNSPGDLMVLNNYAYYLAEQNQNLKEAENMSRRTIISENPNATYLDTYAWILYKRGRLKEAAKIMKGIIDGGSPEDAEYYEHYGYILKGLNKCEEAIEIWKKAIALDDEKENLNEEISDCIRNR